MAIGWRFGRCRWSTALYSIFIALGLASAQALAVPVTSAAYNLIIQDSSSFQSSSAQLDGIATLSAQFLNNDLQSVANVRASPFGPFVDAAAEVDKLQPAAGDAFCVFASAGILYTVQVRQTLELPLGITITDVPITIHAAGDAQVSGAISRAEARVRSVELGLDLFATASCSNSVCTPEQDFDSTVSGSIAPGVLASIGISVDGSAAYSADVPGFSGFQAVADPQIQIDPNFAFRDFFTVDISPNIDVASVAEPGTLGMLLGGLLMLSFAGFAKRSAPRLARATT